MRNFLVPALFLLTLLISAPVSATLIGNTIDGELTFGGYGSTNFYDPSNTFVPGWSSGIQPQAIVQDPDPGYVELMYLDGFNGLDVDVDAFTISLIEFPVETPGSLNNWEINLSGFDTEIAGFQLLSSNFGSSLAISNTIDSFTFVFDGSIDNVRNGLQAVIAVNEANAPVPEPATMLLFGTGLAGLAGAARRKKAQKK